MAVRFAKCTAKFRVVLPFFVPYGRKAWDVVCNAAAGAGFIFSNNLQFYYHRLYKARQVCSSSTLVSTGGLKRFHYNVSQSADKQHCIAKSGVGHGSRKFIVLSKFSVNWLSASRKIQPIYGMFCRSNSPPSAMRGRYTACWIIPSQFKCTNSYTQIILF